MKTFAAVEPVLVALEAIDVGPEVRFEGLDLETGERLSVAVRRLSPPLLECENTHYCAAGLLLKLSVEASETAV